MLAVFLVMFTGALFTVLYVGKRLVGFKWGDTDCRVSAIPSATIARPSSSRRNIGRHLPD